PRSPNGFLSSGNPNDFTACMNDSKCRNAVLAGDPNSKAAKDAGALKDSGLAKALAPLAAKLDMDAIGKKLAQAGPIAPAIGAAMGGAGGAMGPLLGALANAVQNDPSGLGLGTAYASGGGPGLGAGAKQDDANPFKLMEDPALGAAGSQSFDKPNLLTG